MPSGLKWRVTMGGTGASGAYSLGEVYFYEAFGTQAATGGTAIASDFISGFEPAKAFDGSTSAGWACLTGAGKWVGYEWGAAKTIIGVKLVVRDGNTGQAPTSGTIDYWNGSAWVTAASYSFTSAMSGNKDNRTVLVPLSTSDPNRFARLRPTAGGSLNAYAVAELALRATPGGSNVAAGKIYFARQDLENAFGSFPAGNAFDGNSATCWASLTTIGQTWLGVDFGAGNGQSIAELVLTTRSDSNSNQAPTGFVFEQSGDLNTWTEISTVSTGAWNILGESRTFTFAAASTRRRRMIVLG